MKEKKNIYFDIETTGLKSIETVVTAICAKSDKGKFGICNDSETDVLLRYNTWLHDHPKSDYQVVSKNGKMFDMPFMIVRGIVNGIDLTDMLKYDHFDLHEVTKSRVSLDDMARLYGVKTKTANGLQAIDWYHEGKFKDILDYCHGDVEVTEEVHKKWKELNPKKQ